MNLLGRYLAVGAFGFLGAIARLAVGQFVGRFGLQFPLGTMIINLSGSMFLGWFTTYALPRNVPDLWRAGIGIGFVGAYTTFSTLMYESNSLLEQGALLKATANLAGSFVLGMLAVRLGVYMARGF